MPESGWKHSGYRLHRQLKLYRHKYAWMKWRCPYHFQYMKKADSLLVIWRFMAHIFTPKLAYWLKIGLVDQESSEQVYMISQHLRIVVVDRRKLSWIRCPGKERRITSHGLELNTGFIYQYPQTCCYGCPLGFMPLLLPKSWRPVPRTAAVWTTLTSWVSWPERGRTTHTWRRGSWKKSLCNSSWTG